MIKKISLILALFMTVEQCAWATNGENLVSSQPQTMPASNSDSETANEETVENRQIVSELASSNFEAIQENAAAGQTLTAESAGEFILGSREGSLGLLVSYLGDEDLEHQAFTYDQAVAGIEFIQEGDLTEANRIFEFFNSSWDGSGFFTVYNTLSKDGSQIEQAKILGPNAWIGLFALHYYRATGDRRGVDLAKNIAAWAESLPKQSGARAMGSDNASANVNYGNLFSTENNLDYYSLLGALVQILPDTDPSKASFVNAKAQVKDYLVNHAYDRERGLFRRGLNDPNAALDVNSWAILVLGADVLESDFGINIHDFVSRIEANFAVKQDGGFGGSDFTRWIGFDFSDETNAALAERRGVNWVEGTQHMIAVYHYLSGYYEAKGDAVAAEYYGQRRDYFTALNPGNAVSDGSLVGLAYSDTPGARVFHDNPGWILPQGPALSSTAWSLLSDSGYQIFHLADDLPQSATEAVARLQEAVASSSLSADVQEIFSSAYDIVFANSLNRVELKKLLDQGILIDENGYYRPAPIAPIEAVADFRNQWRSFSDVSAVESVLLAAFNINLSDGIDVTELQKFYNLGLIFDDHGVIKEAGDTLVFLNAVYDFVSAYNALTPAQKDAVDEHFAASGLNLAGGITLDVVSMLGDPDLGILYDAQGNLRDPAETLANLDDADDFTAAVDAYLSAYNALSPANKTKANSVLLVFGLNLSDGISDAEKTILGDPALGLLYATGGVLRNPTDSMAFYIVVANFKAAYDALSALNKTKVDPTLLALGLTLGTLNTADINILGSPTNGILYDQTGTPRDPVAYFQQIIDGTDFNTAVSAYLAAYNALSPANKTKANSVLLVFGLNLTDGLSDAEKTILGDPALGLLYATGGVLRNPTDSMAFYIVVSNFKAAYDALSALNKTKVDPTLLALGLTLGTLNIADINILGSPTSGILYDQTGTPRDPVAYFQQIIDGTDFNAAINAYLGAYNSLSAANKTKVNTVLSVFGINLADGLSDAEKTILADPTFGLLYAAGQSGGTLRNPHDSMNFYIAVADFKAAYDVLSVTNKQGADRILSAYALSLATLELSDITILGDPASGILYDGTGTLKDPAQTISAFVGAGLLLNGLQSNPSLVIAFNLLFGTTLPTSGTPAVAVLQSLFDVSGDPAYVQTTFLAALPKASSLYLALQASAQARTDYNLLFGVTVFASGSPSALVRTSMFDTTGGVGYIQADFLSALTKAANLYRALQLDATARTNFNLLFGSDIASTGSPSTASRTTLFNVAGDPLFVQATFLAALPKAASLHTSLTAALRANFETLFGIPVASQIPSNVLYRTALFDITGDPLYVQATFLAALPKASGLYLALQASAQARLDYNLLFGTSVLITGSPSALVRTSMFDTTGGVGYIQADFLSALTKAAPLYQSLQSNATSRTNYNILFGVTVVAPGSPSSVVRTSMFDTAGDPAFNLSLFVGALNRAGPLYQSLQADTQARLDYNLLFGVTVPASGPPSATVRGSVFNVAGDPAFVLSSFLFTLGRGAFVYRDLQLNSVRRNNFNTLYGASIPASGPPPGTSLGILFGIVGDPSLDLQAFLNSLD